jgi:hypothetical protein
MAYTASVDIPVIEWLGRNCTVRSTLALVGNTDSYFVVYCVLSVIKMQLLHDKDSSLHFSVLFSFNETNIY